MFNLTFGKGNTTFKRDAFPVCSRVEGVLRGRRGEASHQAIKCIMNILMKGGDFKASYNEMPFTFTWPH